MFVPCVYCVLRRKRPLRRADHSFRGFLSGCVCVCVCVCGLETSTVRRPRTYLGCCAREEEKEGAAQEDLSIREQIFSKPFFDLTVIILLRCR
jgi:hypothetical protein